MWGQGVVRRQVGVISGSGCLLSVRVDQVFVSWCSLVYLFMVWDAFLWWAFCVPLPLRLLLLCALLSTRPAVFDSQSPPLSSPYPYSSPVQCDSLRGDQLLTQGERSEHLQYSRAQLLAVTAARLTSALVCPLRSLQIGVGLPRKRYRRKRK